MRVFPIADHALTVEFGQDISLALHEQVCRLDQALTTRPFAGLQETIPAYASLGVFYAPEIVAQAYPTFPSAQAAVIHYIEHVLHALPPPDSLRRRQVTLPVCYDLRCGPDLPFVAQQHGLSVEEVIACHSHRVYRVFMLGFLPGFAYLGLVDERIATPRRPTPRAQVPAGSVGIAGRQTGIYPTASPGGWQIIGQTPARLFNPYAPQPAYLQPGDEVRFSPMSYDAWLAASASETDGIWG